MLPLPSCSPSRGTHRAAVVAGVSGRKTPPGAVRARRGTDVPSPCVRLHSICHLYSVQRTSLLRMCYILAGTNLVLPGPPFPPLVRSTVLSSPSGGIPFGQVKVLLEQEACVDMNRVPVHTRVTDKPSSPSHGYGFIPSRTRIARRAARSPILFRQGVRGCSAATPTVMAPRCTVSVLSARVRRRSVSLKSTFMLKEDMPGGPPLDVIELPLGQFRERCPVSRHLKHFPAARSSFRSSLDNVFLSSFLSRRPPLRRFSLEGFGFDVCPPQLAWVERPSSRRGRLSEVPFPRSLRFPRWFREVLLPGFLPAFEVPPLELPPPPAPPPPVKLLPKLPPPVEACPPRPERRPSMTLSAISITCATSQTSAQVDTSGFRPSRHKPRWISDRRLFHSFTTRSRSSTAPIML
ncbi:hypothetical protein FPV67DRAFT_796536 [Lyophyllum atratum]|nr:hypothetical protein FPV67DRAFT_796536 [Lyophyllum atratum]